MTIVTKRSQTKMNKKIELEVTPKSKTELKFSLKEKNSHQNLQFSNLLEMIGNNRALLPTSSFMSRTSFIPNNTLSSIFDQRTKKESKRYIIPRCDSKKTYKKTIERSFTKPSRLSYEFLYIRKPKENQEIKNKELRIFHRLSSKSTKNYSR